MPRLIVPAQLRDLTGGEKELLLDGNTVGEVLRALVARYPAVKSRIFDEEGAIEPTIAIAVDGEVERHYPNFKVRPDSELSIIPAIGGG
ncbi:MAG: MoaD/ThiS family protein [Chloroflexi bacterium]|nr:MoaD/ThiS family protein [Chloroflexota bacterium]